MAEYTKIFSKLKSWTKDKILADASEIYDGDYQGTTSNSKKDQSTINETLRASINNARIASANAVSTTYANLVTLRDNDELIAGCWYRIIDYSTNVNATLTEFAVASHSFDILVLALDESNLSEEAFATHHDGDTYFANSKLEAWKLWYCLDNDTNRFEWAEDQGQGTGVIYRMIDEYGNDAPFDFKNILWITTHLTTTGQYDTTTTLSGNAYTYLFNVYTTTSITGCADATVKQAGLTLGGSKAIGQYGVVNNVIKPNIKAISGKLVYCLPVVRFFVDSSSDTTTLVSYCVRDNSVGYSCDNIFINGVAFLTEIKSEVSTLTLTKPTNVLIKSGVNTYSGTLNHTYQTVVGVDSNGDVREYCPEDVISDTDISSIASTNLD